MVINFYVQYNCEIYLVKNENWEETKHVRSKNKIIGENLT